MSQFELANENFTRSVLRMNFSTDGTGATALSTGAIDTEDDRDLTLYVGITAVTPINPNTYNIVITYALTQSDNESSGFTAVPAENFVLRDSASPITQVYSGGGTPGADILTLKEIGLIGTKRFLKVQLTQSSSTSGDAKSANFGLFMVGGPTLRPTPS